MGGIQVVEWAGWEVEGGGRWVVENNHQHQIISQQKWRKHNNQRNNINGSINNERRYRGVSWRRNREKTWRISEDIVNSEK